MCDDLPALDVDAMSVTDLGRFLDAEAARADRAHARWLVALGEFDHLQGWAADGCTTAVHWLVTHARLSRSTAFEKLRVALELRRRPGVRSALLDGRISYSAARAITRAVGADRAVDDALVDLAVAGTVDDVERMVRVYTRHADQHRAPSPVHTEARRALTARPNGDGTTTVTATVTDLEAAELSARLAAVAAPPTAEAPLTAGSRPARHADALMALVRLPDADPAPAADRHMVHHLYDHATGSTTLLDGTPLDEATAATVRCDATAVTHVLDPGTSEPLALGRASRTWNTAQRRAVVVRDGGRCRWPGCNHRTVDVHHVISFDDGGPTDVANGCLLCRRHHVLTHAGYTMSGTPDGELTWHLPVTGVPLGSSRPLRPITRRVLEPA